jgi:hypothetical protein
MFQKILERMAFATPDTEYLRQRISVEICSTREPELMDLVELDKLVKDSRN